MTSQIDRTFEAFKKLVPYLRGALWWAQNDLIKYQQEEFNQNDEHVGHPLLSVSKKSVVGRFDVVPMLVGTTGKTMDFVARSKCIMVTGMTRRGPENKTYFGSIIQPGNYIIEDMVAGTRPKQVSVDEYDKYSVKNRDDERAAIRKDKWFASSSMTPNWDKPMVSASEMESVNRWCKQYLGD